MAAKVVDASALASLIFAEPEASLIEARLRGHELAAPTLLPFEMSSVCLKKLRAHPDQRLEILARFRLLESMPIELMPVDPYAIAEVSELLRLSAYDASYLLLARHLSAELVTLDAQLAQAMRRT
ncbi:MAG TPA: type II toxin-antitoxin system VapC family toxin [Xanthobacteraceae bacterium]|nr:type II toxin-antitoxin system VapC family toxin [Xanthobacteraceae bacterium]